MSDGESYLVQRQKSTGTQHAKSGNERGHNIIIIYGIVRVDNSMVEGGNKIQLSRRLLIYYLLLFGGYYWIVVAAKGSGERLGRWPAEDLEEKSMRICRICANKNTDKNTRHKTHQVHR